MMPTLNVHFQSTDIPTADGDDMEEPMPPSEARVEFIIMDKPSEEEAEMELSLFSGK